jgi:hypothetical protein
MDYSKTLIYTSPVNYKDDFIVRIVEAAATIRQQPDIVERKRQSLLCRCRLCTDVGGRTFEYPL